jgi:amino acid adenylation domain-containing protein/non-ribosomal peptide synthase protein (TIGR01720 family)
MSNCIFPLTLTQHDIYFDQLHYPNSPLYNIGGYIRFGSIEINNLTAAHKQIVAAHDAFGIRILSSKSGIEQTISNERTTQLRVVDFSHNDDNTAANNWLTELFETPMEIDNSELFRAYLLKISDQEFWYVGFAHHLCMDGIGFANWAEQLGRLYNGEAQVLTEHVDWQTIADNDQQYLNSKKYQNDRQFWANQPALRSDKLLTSHYQHKYARNEVVASRREILSISPQQVSNIKAFAKQSSAQVAHVFFAMLSSYFSKAYSQQQLVFGIPAHNRKNHQQKQMPGVFTSISPLALNVEGEDSFEAVLAQIIKQMASNYRHQRYPIGHIIKDLNIEGEQKSLYDVCFNYLKLDSQINVEGQNCDLVFLSHNHEATPLLITIWEYGDRCHTELQLDFNVAYFDEHEVHLLAERFSHWLDQVLAQPSEAIQNLTLLPSAESQNLLSYNETQVVYNDDKLMHQLFIEQVTKSPDATALIDEEGKLTYLELFHEANCLCQNLGRLALKHEELIAIRLPKGRKQVIAALSILMAGAAYLPMEMHWPDERCNSVFEQAKCRYYLADMMDNVIQNSQAEALNYNNFVTVALKREQIIQQAKQFVFRQVPTELAYVIFTSGSTGVPKGVAIEHRMAVNTLNDINSQYHVSASDRVLAVSALSFDLSVYDIFGLLAVGGAIVCPHHQQATDPQHWLELAEKHQVTLWDTVPVSAGLLIEQLELQQRSSRAPIRLVMMSGDWIAPNLPSRLNHYFPHADLYSLGGATEGSIWSIHYPIKKDTKDWKSIPYGKPLANQSFYILNQQLELVPTGTVGELCIGGKGVARGYFGDDVQTNERFIMHPIIGERLYRTGDLGRYMSDGNIEFVGRVDHQVKIRGFRIELGEIESHLSRMDIIDDVVAMAMGEGNAKRLIAYVVLSSSKENDEERKSQHISLFRDVLKQVLPSHMLPSGYVFLDRLPLSVNGKVDRKGFPEPQEKDLLKAEYVSPKSQTEECLVGLMGDLLGLEKVGLNDNFFELGGDSIMSIQLVARAKKQGLFFTAKQIFENPTISSLLPQVTFGTEVEAEQGTVSGDMSLMPIQQHFFHMHLAKPNHFNQSVFLDSSDTLQIDELHQVVLAAYQRHDALRLRFNEHQAIQQAQFVELDEQQIIDSVEYHNLLGLTEAEQQSAVTTCSQKLQQSVDIHRGPLIKFAYFLRGTADKTSSQLSIVVHHLAIDGVSWRVLLADLELAVAQIKKGQTIRLATKTSSYQQWVNFIYDYSASEDLLDEVPYWIAQLRKPLADFPTIHTGQYCEKDCHTINWKLDADNTQALLGESNTAYRTTTIELLLGALHRAYQISSDHNVMRVEMEGHGREELNDTLDISETLGWFTSLYPLVLDTVHDADLATTIKQIKEQYRAVPHQGIGFGILKYINEIEPFVIEEKRTSSLLFNYLGQFDSQQEHEAFFKPNLDLRGKNSADVNAPMSLLTINAMVMKGHLDVSLSYPANCVSVHTFFEEFQKQLKAFIEHCSFVNFNKQNLSQLARIATEDHNIEEFSI